MWPGNRSCACPSRFLRARSRPRQRETGPKLARTMLGQLHPGRNCDFLLPAGSPFPGRPWKCPSPRPSLVQGPLPRARPPPARPRDGGLSLDGRALRPTEGEVGPTRRVARAGPGPWRRPQQLCTSSASHPGLGPSPGGGTGRVAVEEGASLPSGPRHDFGLPRSRPWAAHGLDLVLARARVNARAASTKRSSRPRPRPRSVAARAACDGPRTQRRAERPTGPPC